MVSNEDFRTDEQFLDIIEDMYNGNWRTAAKNCVNYGFYANDLKTKYQELSEQMPSDMEIWDFVELVELAEDYRGKPESEWDK